MNIFRKDTKPRPYIGEFAYQGQTEGYRVWETYKGQYRIELEGEIIPTGAMFSNNNGKCVKKLYIDACKSLNTALTNGETKAKVYRFVDIEFNKQYKHLNADDCSWWTLETNEVS